MQRYEHGGNIYGNAGIALDFSVNLNPLGMPDEVKRALTDNLDACSRYPDRDCRELCGVLSRHEGVPRDNILCGNGAADLIYRLCFGLKPKNALVCAPTFSDYERAVLLAGGEVKYHMLDGNEGFTATEQILSDISDEVEIVFLCNPNNPTGRLTSSDMLEKIAARCEELGALLVIDECFLDFTQAESAKLLMGKFDNIVILKAFTKSYAMAGLRLGYMLSQKSTALTAARTYAQPWSVSAPAQLAGIAALNASSWLDETRKLIARERRFLEDSLGSLGITVYPSDANFLLIKTENPLYDPLLRRGILVRRCTNFKGLDESFTRICVKTRNENVIFIQAVQEVLNG